MVNQDYPKHYNRQVKRKAEFIKPPNTLKAKVGSGGISDEILNKAQALLENNAVDFQPLAEMYLNALLDGIKYAQEAPVEEDREKIIVSMLYPAMQLKANGGMFHYPLITQIGDRLIQFLEVIDEPDIEAIEIVLAFHATMRAIVMSRIAGDGGEHGEELYRALEDACMRYFERFPDNRQNMQ